MSETPEDAPRDEPGDEPGARLKRTAFSLGAFIITLGFVWIVFDSFALALLAALVFGGGAQLVQGGPRKP